MAENKTDAQIIKSIYLRYIAVLVGVLIFVGALVWRVARIQMEERPVTTQQVVKVIPKRGDILDRNGRVLACSVPEYEVYFDSRIDFFKKNPNILNDSLEFLAAGLARVFAEPGHDKQYFYKKLVDAKINGKMLKLREKNVDYNTLQALKKLPILCNGAYRGGFTVNTINNRVYPYGGMATRVIGSFQDDHGRNGIERAYDKYLFGDPELKQNNIALGGNGEEGDGCDIVTTIDADIQTITHEELMNVLKKYDAEWGCAIVMDVKSGEILSTTNLSRNDDPADSNFYENYNYAVKGRCDPGSTIKLSALMVAFEDNYVKLTDTIDTGNGVVSYKNDQLTVTDWVRKTRGDGFHKIPVREVFAQSSNVGISKIINEHYEKRGQKGEWEYIERLKSMGLDQKSGVDLQGELPPKVKDPSMTTGEERWNGTTLLQMSYGYEIELTPLQILNFYNAVANNGKVVAPHYVKEIRKDAKIVKKYTPRITRSSICSKETLRKSHDILEAVVEMGTAKKYASKYYKIAGKTGTAQTFEKGHYNKGKWRGSFCGYFPADNPKYSCIVVIQAKEAGEYSAVGAFKKIADRIFFMDEALLAKTLVDTASVAYVPMMANGYRDDFKNIFNTIDINYADAHSQWVKNDFAQDKVTMKDLKVDKVLVPDFRGMGMRDVLYLADSLNILVECHGLGKLKRQSIVAGSAYKPNDLIVMEFE